jgi:hypothetical protein
LAWCGPLSVSLLEMVVVGPFEVRQQGLEGGHRQAGQLLEDSGSKAELLEVQHTRVPRSRRKGIAYSKDDLIPIKSNVEVAGRAG